MASALRISTPVCAPRLTPPIALMGVARPSAHGHANMSTATAFVMANARRGSGPKKIHPRNVSAAIASTAGTNHAATLSAKA